MKSDYDEEEILEICVRAVHECKEIKLKDIPNEEKIRELCINVDILNFALKYMSEEFDRFIESCLDDKGKPKSPTYKDVMRARGYLPPYCNLSFGYDKNK